MNVGRFYRTVSHLRASQIYWRFFYSVLRKVECQAWYRLQARTSERCRNTTIANQTVHCPGDGHTQSTNVANGLQQGKLTLLNQSQPFAGGADWMMTNGRSHRLWTINLHYHRWIVDLAMEAQRGSTEAGGLVSRMLLDWMDHCVMGRTGFADLAWNSYAIATRLDSWRQLLTVLPDAFWEANGTLRDRLIESMGHQADYLSRHIEWDIRGNHLLRNALGLACAGRVLDGGQANRWLDMATELALNQVQEQFLPDGGHFERSPAYHVEQMMDVLKLMTLLPESAANQLRPSWHRMVEFALWMRHPDGLVVQFNDTSSRDPHEVLSVAEMAGIVIRQPATQGGRYFDSSGIVAWHGDPWTVFFDVGEIGAGYQPSHAHADTLSIECSLNGRRLFVDPGSFSYDNDERRSYDRSTAAHNTVCIDNRSSSEMWHIFRVGRRANPIDVVVDVGPDGLQASGSHNGYDDLPGSPQHRRKVRIRDEVALEIEDHIVGMGRHHVEGGFLLAPEWSVDATDDGWSVSHGANQVSIQLQSDRAVTHGVQTRPIHCDYGVEVDSNRLVWCYHGVLPVRIIVQVKLVANESSIHFGSSEQAIASASILGESPAEVRSKECRPLPH